MNWPSPWDLEGEITRSVKCYHHESFHETIGNMTQDEMVHGR
jgi:hypothetical protein